MFFLCCRPSFNAIRAGFGTCTSTNYLRRKFYPVFSQFAISEPKDNVLILAGFSADEKVVLKL